MVLDLNVKAYMSRALGPSAGASRSRRFAVFYTGVIGAGGLAPIAYGAIADHSSRAIGILAAALTAALIVPLALALRPVLRGERDILVKQI